MPEQPGVDLGALSDLCTPWCVHVAATLRVAEQIDAGTTDIQALAAAVGCDTDALHQVLGHLVQKGVFAEVQPGQFALNEAARGLLDPGQRIGLNLDGIGGRLAYAWGTLLTYVRTGAPAYQDLFGRPFWEDLDAHPDLAADFDALIGPIGHGAPDAEFPISGGWETVRTVVDVGGGTGAMLAALLRSRPNLEGILVDQPQTVARGGPIFQAAGVSERVTTSAQSFFDPLPAGKDMYLLRGILNDWPDREALAILKRCAEAARPDGRVIVLKGIEADGAPKSMAIEMVLLGGKYRSVAALGKLARQAGLQVIATERQQSGDLVVECRPI